MTDPHLQREFDLMLFGGDMPKLSSRKKKLLYVSGPMSSHPEDFNFPAFNEAAERLRAEGWEVVNPADKGIVDGWEWEDYLRYDIKQICDCDAVYMLKGWPSSRGARLERKVAESLGLEVLYE